MHRAQGATLTIHPAMWKLEGSDKSSMCIMRSERQTVRTGTAPLNPTQRPGARASLSRQKSPERARSRGSQQRLAKPEDTQIGEKGCLKRMKRV